MSNQKQLTMKLQGNALTICEVGNENNNSCSITFHRTLRIPDDGKTYPLPPSLGHFPLCKVDDYWDKVPEDWKKTGGIFFPMHQREAMWMQFSCRDSQRPKALKVGVGKVNAISGQLWTNELEENGYVTLPKQPWLDGINAGGEGRIKQFVAMPLGSGYSVEAQVTGEEKFGGIQLMVFDSKEEERRKKFPPVTRPEIRLRSSMMKKKSIHAFCATAAMNSHSNSHSNSMVDDEEEECCADDLFAELDGEVELSHSYYATNKSIRSDASSSSSSSRSRTAPPKKREQAKEMSLSAGGSMKQEITKDSFGIDFWDPSCFARVYVRIVNSEMYEQITGKKAPETPITAQTYSSYGYPWFDVYNESPQNSIAQSGVLNQVKSVKQIDSEKYAWPQQNDDSIQLSASQVKSMYHKKDEVRDGDW